MHKQEPRKINAEETKQLVQYLMRDERDPSPAVQAFVKRTVNLSSIAIFDQYAGDGGDQSDKLMTVIWPGHRS